MRRERRAARPGRRILASLFACACLPATAHAAQSARLHVAFTPERLGRATTVELAIQIAAPAHRVPPPLTALNVSYPGKPWSRVSGLGLATCSRAKLEALGPDGCPADSRMGQGSALAEVPIGPEIVSETAQVTIVRAPVSRPGFDGDRFCRFPTFKFFGGVVARFFAAYSSSISRGGRSSRASCRRSLLNQATYSRMASSSCERVAQLRSEMSSVLKLSTKLSAAALS